MSRKGQAGKVWARDRRQVGVTLHPPFTDEVLQQGTARLKDVLAREGGIDNAVISYEVREDTTPAIIDMIAEWDGFIAPDAESGRIWSDADASFGREREVVRRLRKLAGEMAGKTDAARVTEVADWLEVP